MVFLEESSFQEIERRVFLGKGSIGVPPFTSIIQPTNEEEVEYRKLGEDGALCTSPPWTLDPELPTRTTIRNCNIGSLPLTSGFYHFLI